MDVNNIHAGMHVLYRSSYYFNDNEWRPGVLATSDECKLTEEGLKLKVYDLIDWNELQTWVPQDTCFGWDDPPSPLLIPINDILFSYKET